MTDPYEPKIPSTLTPERFEEIGKRVEAFKGMEPAIGSDAKILIDLFAEVQFLSGLINDLIQDGAAERWEAGYAKGHQDALDSSKALRDTAVAEVTRRHDEWGEQEPRVPLDELTHSHHGWGEEKTHVSLVPPDRTASCLELQQWSGTESTNTPTYVGPVHSTLMEALQSDEAKAISEGMNRHE